MDQQKKINQYWKEINREIAVLKDNSLKNADVVSNQSDKLDQIDYNNKIIDHNVKLSKWLLNLIDSTFGKIYQKIHSMPKKEKNVLKSSSNINSLNRYSTSDKNSISESVINDLEEIKSIHKAIGNEIDKQNLALENINNKTNDISDNLENNIRHCKKIIRNT